MTYRLSNKAADDYARLYEYGIANFGHQQAHNYAEGMEERFEIIGNNPLRYPAVDHYLAGCRRSVYRSHSIFFRQCTAHVEIVRILSREDIEKALQQ